MAASGRWGVKRFFLMKMRDLEARTGVNRETIRVYLRHGLVPAPARPKPNVADYDDSHTRAIVAVRDLQRDSGLTLRQIKDVLNGQSGDRRVEAGAFRNLEELVSAHMGNAGGPIMIASLQAQWPEAQDDARKLENIGVIRIAKTPDGPAVSVTDARLVTIWGEMRKAGFTEEFGFTPALLSYYAQPATEIGQQEARLFMERTDGRMDTELAAEMVQKALPLMLDFFGLIRMKAFLGQVQKIRTARKGRSARTESMVTRQKRRA